MNDANAILAAISAFGGVVSLLCAAVCTYWGLDVRRRTRSGYMVGGYDEPK